jgi:N-acetylmuramic acid 6-phosphate etherase
MIEVVERAFRRDGRLFYAGAGTSGRLGILDASECPPTFGVPATMVQGLIAGGHAAIFAAQEGAEDSPERGAMDVDAVGFTPNDVLVGIAASGTTPYVHGALRRAKALGGTTGMVAHSTPPAAILDAIDVPMIVITGPEVVTGSTRMKAGTGTKMVLNMITTGAMIRLGKTYGNLMVDVQTTNAKLRDRSERIVVEVCEVAREDARTLLERAGGRVKLAIVMHRLGTDRAGAEAALEQGGGVIRRVVPGEPPPVA